MYLPFATAAQPVSDFQSIKDYLLIERTALCPADIILIFGNRHCVNETAAEGAKLYHKGYAPKIIASGGRPIEDGISEAKTIKNALLKHGVRADDIIIESRSTNTQENVLFSKKMVKKIQPNIPIKRVIGIGTLVAGRRFLMTLAKNWPEVLPMISNKNPFDTPVDEWFNDESFKKIIMSEYSKIPTYVREGFIKEVNLSEINKRIQTDSTIENPCQHLRNGT